MLHQPKLLAITVSLVGALSLSSAGAESPKSQNGINLSEWGREAVLSELSANAEVRAAESNLPQLDDFLSGEIETFGAGAVDPDRLRQMMANRAIGREDDSALSWMSSRWESAPGRFANFITDYAEARLGALPGVESADIQWSPTGDNPFGAFSASGVGALRPSESQAFGIQPKIEHSRADGKLFGSFGLFHRRALGDSAVAGVNAFSEHMDDPNRGAFSRWWLGADFASAWADADVKRYFGDDGREFRRNGRRFQAYSPDGISAELRVHSPNLRWLEGYAKFSEWQGRGGNPDQRSKSFGLTFQPHAGMLAGLRTDAEISGDDVNLELAYAWTLGKGAARPSNADPFAVYSKIADPVLPAEGFELYEVAHLYEYLDRFGDPNGLGEDEIFRRVALAWAKVPPYLQISENLWRHCPVPQFISLWNEGSRFTAYAGDMLWTFTPSGLCNTLNGDHSGPLGWWLGRNAYREYRGYSDGNGDYDMAGSLLFMKAAENLDVDSVKLLLIAGVNVNDEGIFSGHPSTSRNPYAGAHYFAYEYRSEATRQTALEGVALRYNLAKALNHSADILARALTIAVILRANDAADCRPNVVDLNDSEISEVCNTDKGGNAKFQRVEVPTGDLLPANSAGADAVAAYVAQGYTGEIFRITATSKYADVNYTMSQPSGQNFSLTVDGTYQMYYDPFGRGYRETKRDLTGDTRIAIVHLTNQALPAASYALTVTADFFYHRVNQPNVTAAYTVAVLAQPAKQTPTWGELPPLVLDTLDSPRLQSETFVWTGGSPLVTVQEDGKIQRVGIGPLPPGETLTLYADAVSPDEMAGTLKFTVEAQVAPAPPLVLSEHDQNWPALPTVYATDQFTGAAFTVTTSSSVDSVVFSLDAENHFSVDTRGALGIVNIASVIPADSLKIGTVFARLEKAGSYPVTLEAAFAVSIVAQDQGSQTFIVKDEHVTQADNSDAQSFEFPDIPGMTFAEDGTVPDEVKLVGDRIRVNSKLVPAQGVTLTVRGTSSNLRGYMRIVVVMLNPDLDDPRALKHLVNEGCSPDGSSGSSDYSLYRAVRSGDLSAVCQAIRQGADVDQSRRALVRYAVQKGAGLGVKRALLANGARVKEPTSKRDVVHYVARHADEKVARFLTRYMARSQGGNAPSWNDAHGTKATAPVHEFAAWVPSRGGNPDEAMQAMVAGGANVNLRNADGNNALHLMLKEDNKSASQETAAKVLLQNGLDSNDLTPDGKLPLSETFRRGNDDMSGYLLYYADGSDGSIRLNLRAVETVNGVTQSPIHAVRDEFNLDEVIDFDGGDGDAILKLTNSLGETLLDVLAAIGSDVADFADYVRDDYAGECRLNENVTAEQDRQIYEICQGY